MRLRFAELGKATEVARRDKKKTKAHLTSKEVL
jgi:hypothetical protein